jgi:hypothetical protein
MLAMNTAEAFRSIGPTRRTSWLAALFVLRLIHHAPPLRVLTKHSESDCYHRSGDEENLDHAETDYLTACPSCGAPMRFLRTVPPLDGLPELQTFACKPCGLAVTAEQVLRFPELLLPLTV